MKDLKQNPLFWAALLSFLLSLSLSFHDVINQDGILYLGVAREFLAQRYAEGFALYNWAFYPALIAGLSSITSLSLEHSAILLNAGFFALMAAGFVALIRTLGGNKTVQWIALLVFLVHPGINGYREYIVRDFGAWAFLIASLVFLCRFSQKRSWGNVIGWTLTVSLSVLFRPEAIAWLALGPLALFVTQPGASLKQKGLAWLQCMSIFLLIGVGALAALLILPINLPATKLHEITHVIQHLLTAGATVYQSKAEAFGSLMSIYFSLSDALITLSAGLLIYLVYHLVKLLSLLYLGLIGYALYHRPLIKTPEVRFVIWMLIIYSGLYLLFLSHNYFISSRYLVPWICGLMVWVPFALHKLWGHAPSALKITIALLLVYMFLDSVLHFGYSKMYLKESGLWIHHHSLPTARLYTDSKQVAYYADRPLAGEGEPADIIALRYSRKMPDRQLEFVGLSAYEQVDFHNKREDGVRVIVINPSSKETSGE
jgi:hypothetical protein